MDAGADHRTALADGAQRHRHELARRSEDDRGVELLGRLGGGVARPDGSEPKGESLRCVVTRAREREDAAPLAARDLRDDVRRGAEAVEADPLGVAGAQERAIADEPAQRSGAACVSG